VPSSKRPRVAEESDDVGLDELEAARAALRAQLNGVAGDRYDSNSEEQYSFFNEYENMGEGDRSGRDSYSRDSDKYRSDIGLAITIKGDTADESRLVSDKGGKSRKFTESASIGLIANYGSNENSEEEGEIQNDLNDELIEYAMHENGSTHRHSKKGKHEKSKDNGSESYQKSFEKEYEEIRMKHEKERERKKEKKDKEKKSEKREKDKKKDKERDKDHKRKEKEDSKRKEDNKNTEKERSR